MYIRNATLPTGYSSIEFPKIQLFSTKIRGKNTTVHTLITLKLLFNLQGELIYTKYSYSKECDVIPIDVIDKIDTELREKVKITVERFRRDTEKNIYNIELNLYFPISPEGADKQ